MSKLTQIQKAVSDLAADEVYELAKWLLEYKLADRRHKAEPLQESTAPELFRGILVRGRSGSGKFSFAKKINLKSDKP